jgi:hypothetical protein
LITVDRGGAAFRLVAFTAWTQTLVWMSIFFFGSAGALSAYLTASEIFPLETRLILGAAPIEALFGIDAEGLSLEEITDPLSSQ